jgi:hypothetical protein
MSSQDIRQTVDVLKSILSDGSQAITPEIAKTLNVNSGLQMYNLEPAAKVLTPIFSPVRNRIPRKKGFGKAIEFKAVTEVDTTGQNAVALEGSLASAVLTGLANVTVGYRSYGLSSDPVTYEAEWASEQFGTRPRELAIANLLKAVMRAEEKLLLFGQGAPAQITSSGTTSWTFGGLIGAAPTPTLAGATVAGGALVPATTYYVKVTAVTGMGESLPSAVGSLAPGGANNTLAVTPVYPTGVPALSFNIYASTAVGGPFYLAGSTNGAVFNLLSIPGPGTQPPVADASGNTNSFNGIFPYLFATGSGAQIIKQSGALASLAPINTLLANLFNASAADPTDIYVNSKEAQTITTLTLGAGGTPYFLTVDNQNAATANYRVARLVNPITGSEIKVTTHKYLPQGNILAISHELPEWYVGSEIDAPFEMSLVQDYTQIDYPPVSTQTTWLSEIRCYGALQGYVPSAHGAIVGIS